MRSIRKVLQSLAVLLLTMPACQCPSKVSSPPQIGVGYAGAPVSTARQVQAGWHAEGPSAFDASSRRLRAEAPAPQAMTAGGGEGYPSVTLSADPGSGGAPLGVTLEANIPYEKPDMVLHWDFGDGAQAGGGMVQHHRYMAPGQYTAKVSLQWRDVHDEDTADVEVDQYGFDVDVDADPISGDAPLRVQLTATPGDDIGGDGNLSGYQFEWDLGDGTREFGPVVSATYGRPGTYEVSVVVTNPQGQKGRGEAEIEADEADESDAQ